MLKLSNMFSPYDVSDGLDITDCEALFIVSSPPSEINTPNVPMSVVNVNLPSSCVVSPSISVA